jgi:GTPase SAR1 family protein
MLDMWINFGEGFLLVFAINDYESFECLEKKRDRILKLKKGQNCPIVLVGNKCDLESERVISQNDAKELARQWNAGYIETSATVYYLYNINSLT